MPNVKDVVVIGNGNVAIDISRVFLKDPQELMHTDIPSAVIEELKRSSIKHIHMIGRRGLVQAASTTKEVREISRIKNVEVFLMRDEIEKSMTD